MKHHSLSVLTAFVMLASASMANAKQYYTKTVVFPADADSITKVEMASRLIPSDKQREWQDLELTAFLHFGVNTFTNREWGDGTESPTIFNPEKLDADQWVKVLKDAGFKMVILTAKHHDGFCLWPTKTTSHSVASSPWRNGQGDVMADLRTACDRHGMKLGVYLSPWDRNAACYGDSPRYNDMFVEQLTELLTQYGKIDEVWFDGANGEGPNGKKQVYDWERFRSVIESLQPDAVMAIMGDDVRWVGNERGQGRETEWSATALTPGILPGAAESNQKIGIFAKAPDLGGRAIVAKADKLHWWPSEVDVSIRNGWFFHDRENPKSLYDLANIYLNSVGRNSVLLLNIPPNRDGLINDNDVERLMELRQWLDSNFSNNLIKKHKKGVAHTAAPVRANCVVLGEDISKGQQVEAFDVECLVGNQWQTLASGTTIGHKRILLFPDAEIEAVRLHIKSSRDKANLKPIELYHIVMPEMEANAAASAFRLVPRTDWRIIAASCDDIADAYKAIDDLRSTFWQSATGEGSKELVIDMGREFRVGGFAYKLRDDNDLTGTVFHYRFFTSNDGENWTECVTPREFSNIVNNPLDQFVYFNNPVDARYVKFVADSEVEGRDFVTVAEFDVLMPREKVQPQDNEQAVYPKDASKLALKVGDEHPTAKGWTFLTSQEFDTPSVGVPAGWKPRSEPHMARAARIDAVKCMEVHPAGYLRLKSVIEPDSIDNGFGKQVKYSSYALNTLLPGQEGFWHLFKEGERIEVRARMTNTLGINDAIWFMGNNDRGWPGCGEIDLLENPKKTHNETAHFTLHSANHYAGVVGGSGSVTANIDLNDMSDWNIFWMEWYPEKIVGGVNGKTFFVHNRGDNGNEDWPWSDPAGFYMLLSSGLSVNPSAWPGAVNSADWDPNNLPHMDIDWIRVFTNSATE